MAQQLSDRRDVLFEHPPRLTRLAKAIRSKLHETRQPVIADFQIYQILNEVWVSGQRLYLRKSEPDFGDLRKLVTSLSKATILVIDRDYGRRVWRIVENSERPAEEVCCLVDPFCYVSHLSAMRRYGLTERIPRKLHLTAPAPKLFKALLAKRMMQIEVETSNVGREKGQMVSLSQLSRLYRVNHPSRVRGEQLEIMRTNKLGNSIKLRGSFARLSTIGQVFMETLESPSQCGGMDHVIDVWERHASNFLDDIVAAVEQAEKSIHKVRAGYILEERLGVKDKRISRWKAFAQRGGSRLLDPMKPYAPRFSEDWMISINAG